MKGRRGGERMSCVLLLWDGQESALSRVRGCCLGLCRHPHPSSSWPQLCLLRHLRHRRRRLDVARARAPGLSPRGR